MRIHLWLFCLILLGIGCQDDDYTLGTLELSTYAEYFDSGEQILKVAIKSNQEWQITGGSGWCRTDKQNGQGDDSLTLYIDENLLSQERKTTWVIKTQDLRKPIRITQQGGKELHYKIPVIFHILYNDPNDPEQNVSAQKIHDILEQCNLMYANSEHSVDMNLEFILATHSPEGELLAEPGIDRITWPSSTTMNCSLFMKDKNILSYIWDLNNFINVFIYSFTNENVLGISYLPYTISDHPLEGLKTGDRYLIEPTLDYPHCISINNQYILTEHSVLKKPDAVITLTHELGHYLGLIHVFPEENYPTDYCDDTPSYDRVAYIDWLNSITPPISFEQLTHRTSPEGIEFTSCNIMDYDYSYLNQFTPDQRKRVRHVLEYSPLLPGPKNRVNYSRSNMNLEKPEARTIIYERKW